MNPVVKYKPARLFYDSYTPEECNASLSPIIFVHGIAGLYTSWNKVWKRIADQTQRKVFTIDIRNHGKSEWNDIFALDAHATDIENFTRENGIKQCCLVGHSLGGKICVRVAMMMPELVDRLVVEEASVRNLSQEEKMTFLRMLKEAGTIRNLKKTMTENQIRTFLSNQAATAFRVWGNRDAAYNLPLRRNSDGSFGFNFNFDAVYKSTVDGSAYYINHQSGMEFYGPALFIFSKGSPLKEDPDMMLKKFFPNAKLQEFKRKAHILHLDCSDEYVENVSKFLNTLEIKINN